MEKKKVKYNSFGYILKISIVILFFAALLFVTVQSISYSINNHLAKMIIQKEDQTKYIALYIPSQLTEEAIKREEEIVHPIDYLEANNYSSLDVKPGEKIKLSTKQMSFIKTKSSNKSLYMRVYKNQEKDNTIEFSPEINISEKNYEIVFNAPEEKGTYTYHFILRFNKYDVEYMFNLEVE